MMSPELALAIGLPLIGGLVWLIRMEGRVNAHEASCTERQTRLDERHSDINRRLASIDEGQARTNDKLDRLLGDR